MTVMSDLSNYPKGSKKREISGNESMYALFACRLYGLTKQVHAFGQIESKQLAD